MTGGLNGERESTRGPTTKGGNIILRRVSVPNNVEPGEAFDVDVLVSNGASYIGPLDPDRCHGDVYGGYKLRVVLIGPSGERLTKGPVCHLRTTIGTKDETYTFTVEAPESGRAEVEAHVEMVDSGKRTDPLEASTLVSSTNPARPDTGSDSSGSGSNPFNFGDDGGGGGGSSPFDPFSGGTEKLTAVIVLALLAWVAASASDTVEAVA